MYLSVNVEQRRLRTQQGGDLGYFFAQIERKLNMVN